MECANCGQDAFNRIIINPTTGEENGGLCEDCEVSKFGIIAAEPLWHRDDGCGLCPAPGEVALPEVDCLVEWDDGTTEAEFTITHSTLQLCTQHLAELLGIEEPATVPPIKTQA